MVGRVFVWTGLMMFGFVAYQLWGTGLSTARAQSEMGDQFEAMVAQAQEASGDSAESTADPDRSIGEAVEAGELPWVPAMSEGEVAQLEPSEIVPDAVDLSDEAVDQKLPTPIPGQSIFRLDIPAIDKVAYVVPGVSLNDLKKGPGHYPDTPMPGQLGNAAIAGHRTTYSAPFHNVDQLDPGDEIIVTNVNGDNFVYNVTKVKVVAPTDYWVVTTRDPNVAELTLTSCHPKYSARQRIVVRSVLDPAKSARVGLPSYYELDEEAAPPSTAPPVATDPPATTAITAAPATTIESDEVTSDSSPAAPATTVPTTTAENPSIVTPDQIEADVFTQGWFDDPDAWPHIAAWGAALALVMIGGYQLAKRSRRAWLGIVVAAAPYVVVSYFLFENINRLLPPGL